MIARFVARRTVYSEADIEGMCTKGEVLAILFHQVLRDFNRIDRQELMTRSITISQSLSRISEEAKPWLRSRTGT